MTRTHNRIVSRAGFAAALVAACSGGHAQAAAPQAGGQPPFADAAHLDASIPTPASVIGHAVGDDAVRFDALVRYLHALAETSDFVTIAEHGRTHEGRALYHLIITSRANHARLEEIRADNARLADPRLLENDAQAEAIIERLPGIAWLASSIHGDEVSPCDSAMTLAYLLAAGTDDQTKRLRDELVILIDPLQNPDGRERYLAQIQTLRGRVENPDYQAMHHAGLWSAGRGNHYLFDMNRDWLTLTQPETRGRVAAVLQWNPHLLVDAHEMGGLDTYLFDPPREPINLHTAPKLLTWRRRMSADQAAAFDQHGWSYYTKEWYEEWYPGYTNSWGSLLGAIGLLYEQAGVSGASLKQEAGTVLTYREAVHHNVVSSLANLETLRAHRKAILRDFLADRQWAISGERPHQQSFIVPPSRDASLRARFIDILRRQGIEFIIARDEVEAQNVVDSWGRSAETQTYPAGSIVIPAAQPHRRLLHSMLDLDPRLSDAFLEEERTELERGRGSRLYDVTAWNVLHAFGLAGAMAERVGAVTPAPGPAREERAAVDAAPAYGYLIDFDDASVYQALAQLLARGATPRIARKPFTLAGHAYRRGAILLRGSENPPDLAAILQEIAAELPLQIRGAETALSDDGPDLGGREFVLLHEPRIAIASQWPTSTTSFGSVWYLLDHRVGLRASPVNIQNLASMDLRRYNVLVLPGVWNPGGLRGVLGSGRLQRIKSWVEAGGTLIAIGGTASYLADEDLGISAVRRRRDVLDELDVYEESVDRELAARAVKVDPDVVWGEAPEEEADQPEAGEKEKPGGRKAGGDDKERERADQWARRFSPRGAIARGHLDVEHWMCFGLGEKLPLPASGQTVYLTKSPVTTPARFAEAGDLRLSGLLWPEARQRMARSAFATVERVGNGQVILFASDPFYRASWEGTGRLLLNAVILGPGMGTSQPIPW